MINFQKLDQRIENILNNETDDFLLNINIKEDVADKLLSYQLLHVFDLITALRSTKVVLDGSDTGTGKTYTSIAICKQLNLRPFIISPKTIMSKWHHVCKYYGVTPITIVNYETIKNGKYYKDDERVDCPFIEIVEGSPDRFKWRLPRNSIIIFDEVHCCKNSKSINGTLLKSTRNKSNHKVLLISATLSDTPKSFNLFGYMLGFYNNIRQANSWIKSMLKEDSCYLGAKPKLSAINRAIYPSNGSRLRIADLGDKFPDNQICADCYDIDKEDIKIVNMAFEKITDGLSKIKSKHKVFEKAQVLKDINKARQNLEIIKIPIFEDNIREYLDNNYSVVVFVNFTRTLMTLSNIFKTDCLLYGDLSTIQRDKNIEDFQSNKSRLIISNIKIGSEGIDLNDKNGNYPRVSLISPCFSAIKLTQALGRIYRTDSKSPALQRIIYCAGTCEEVICNRVNEKLKFTAKLNDDDLVTIE